MLDVFREGAKTWVSKFLIWMVAMTFVGAAFMVWGQKGAQRTAAVAMVGEEEISRAALYQRTKSIESTLREQLGSQFNQDLLKSLDPKTLAMSALIEEALVRQTAAKSGIDISDEETRETIMSMKEFQTDGIFDRRKYQDILRLNGYSTADFEANVRRDLLNAKFRVLIQKPVRVSDTEALDAFMRENQAVIVEYAQIEDADFRKEAQYTEAELKEWFDKRLLEFELPLKRKFRLITAFPARFELSIKISEDEVQKYFEDHKAEFESSESVEASHILAKVTPGAPESSDNAAREKVEKALARIEAGEDFAEVAKEVSEDSSAGGGGSLGKFSRGQMVEAFENTAFSLNVGEVSKPFKTPFGWHIVKVSAKIEAGIPEFDQVKDFARIKAKKNKADEEARAAIISASEEATISNFTEKAKVDKRLRYESLTLSRDESVPGLINSGDLMKTVYEIEPGVVSGVERFPEGYALIVVDEVLSPKTPPLDDVRPRVVERLLAEKSRNLSKEKAEKLKKLVQEEGKTMALAAESVGLKVKTTPPYSMSSLQAGEGPKDAGMKSEAFLMEPGEMKVTSSITGHTAIRLKERLAVNYSVAAERIGEYRQKLLAEKRQRTLAELVSRIRKKAEADGQITIYEN